MLITIAAAVGVYYLWSVALRQDDTVGTALGIIAAVIVSAAFTRLKRRK